MTRAQRLVASSAAALGAVSAALLLLPQPWLPSGTPTGPLSNLLQLLAPALAAATCFAGARRQPGRRLRWAWLLMGVGTAGWGAGQACFTWYDVVLRTEVPVPSVADLGFLAFPVFATAATVLLPRRAVTATFGIRLVLDGFVVAVSLLVVTWSLTLRVLWTAGGDLLPLAVTTAYPLTDVMLIAVVLLLVVRSSRSERVVLVPLALGLAAFAVADSGYVITTSSGSYASGALFDLGWIVGFLLIAVAAALARPAVRVAGEPHEDDEQDGVPSWAQVLLPYLPVAAAVAVLAVRLGRPGSFTPQDVVLSGALVALVLARQFVALADNRALVGQLHAEREQARHQSLHDPLTGLPNRLLFMDRVTHALALSRRTGTPVSVLFCDLDHFKRVNDELGHSVGDAVLVEAGRRMLAALRAPDTLARLGGDEFGVLLEDADDPPLVAQRIVEAMAPPLVVRGTVVHVTASVGLVTVAEGAEPSADDVLVRADHAMYAVKAAGKNGWLAATAPRATQPTTTQPTVQPTGTTTRTTTRTTTQSAASADATPGGPVASAPV